MLTTAIISQLIVDYNTKLTRFNKLRSNSFIQFTCIYTSIQRNYTTYTKSTFEKY